MFGGTVLESTVPLGEMWMWNLPSCTGCSVKVSWCPNPLVLFQQLKHLPDCQTGECVWHIAWKTPCGAQAFGSNAMAFSMRKLKSAVKRTEVCLWRITKHFESKGNVEKWRLLNNLLNCVSCVSSKDAQKLQTSQSNCNFFSSKNSGVSFLKGTVLALFFLVYWGCSKSQIRVVVSMQLTLRAQNGTRAVAFCSNTRNGLSLLVWFSSLDLC